ncbi:MAG: glycosyltransferase family 39 protein [Flavobacteriales bacterium]|nr:glycosyltransferase family 39 protein [Flavobacteriales bacterium]
MAHRDNVISKTHIIVALSLTLLKVILFTLWSSNIELFEAHDIAINLLERKTFVYHVHNQDNFNYQFPIYPTIVAGLYWIFGVKPIVAIIVNQTLLLLTAFICVKILSNVFKAHQFISWGLLILVLLHPALNQYTNMVHPFSLDILFLVSVAYCSLRLYQKRRNDKLILSLVFAFSILNRASMIVLIFPLVYLIMKASIKPRFAIIFILIAILPSSIWILRNYQHYKEISFNSTMGQNLWIGNLPTTEGTATMGDKLNYYNFLPKQDWETILTLSPPKQSKYFIDKWWNSVLTHPKNAVVLYFKKINNFWLFRDHYSTSFSKWFIFLYKLYALLILFALILSFTIHRSKEKWLLLSFVILISLFQAFFYVETRHRMLIEPLLYLIIAQTPLEKLNTRFKLV